MLIERRAPKTLKFFCFFSFSSFFENVEFRCVFLTPVRLRSLSRVNLHSLFFFESLIKARSLILMVGQSCFDPLLASVRRTVSRRFVIFLDLEIIFSLGALGVFLAIKHRTVPWQKERNVAVSEKRKNNY